MASLDGKHVVFGRLVSGHELVRQIEDVPVAAIDSRPLLQPAIVGCGVVAEEGGSGEESERAAEIEEESNTLPDVEVSHAIDDVVSAPGSPQHIMGAAGTVDPEVEVLCYCYQAGEEGVCFENTKQIVARLERNEHLASTARVNGTPDFTLLMAAAEASDLELVQKLLACEPLIVEASWPTCGGDACNALKIAKHIHNSHGQQSRAAESAGNVDQVRKWNGKLVRAKAIMDAITSPT